MAQHIHGPLYYERMGRTGPVIAFVHPNPMDQSCWIFQLAHLSTWYRCIAIDIPGYGRSPKADAGLTMTDMAEACWEADRRRAARRKSNSGRLFGRLVARPSHVPPSSRQDRGTRVVGHRV
jgi:pimeloyl-ACP methyl ester carboxylesterase